MRQTCTKKIRFGFLEAPLSELFYKHSLMVAAHPWPYIIIPLLISGGLGVGYFYKVDTKSAYEMYTPIDGLGLIERQTIMELFPALDGNFTPSRALSWDGECDLIVNAKDGKNILRPAYREAVIKLNDFVMTEIFVKVDNVEYSYQNICLKFLHFCHTNPQIYAFDIMMSNPGPDDNLTYPTARRGQRTFYIGNTLGDVIVDPLSHQIVEAKAWQLVYQLKYDGLIELPRNKTDSYNRISKAWQLEYQRIMLAYKDDLLDIAVVHSQSLDLEIKRNGENIAWKFIFCIVMLFTFANLCSISVIWDNTLTRNWTPYVDWTRSKPTVATAGLFGAIMGVVTTIGMLAFAGFQYNGVVDAMPFVVLGVRLDNTFLMISAVHHTKRTLSATERVAEAMSESAMSITITVLTDVLSFAVGIPTDFMAVQLFSIYTVIAMLITYAYQLTFLLGILVLSVRAEERNAHTLITSQTTVAIAHDEKHAKPNIITRLFCLGTHFVMPSSDKTHKKLSLSRSNSARSQNEKSKVQYQEGTWISRMIKTHYAPFLMKNSTRFGVLGLYLIYLALSIYGCIIMKVGLEPSRLLVSDSYAKKYSDRLADYFWKLGTQAHITFSNAGDLVDKANRDRIFEIVDRFANSEHGMGQEGVTFWLKDFKKFQDNNYNEAKLDSLTNATFYRSLQYFLSMDELGGQFRNDIHWSNASGRENITAFRALVGLKDFTTATKQIETVDLFRSIAGQYPYYNVSTFQIMWVFVDQYEEVPPNTAQEIYGGIAFMVLIAILFIPSMVCTFWVILAILSIDAGTFGFMTFWDINLDVISMICIIMSIGFSVDFTAHIAYHFVVVEGASPVEKTNNALGTLAWPILQGAISTTMGVTALAGGNSYIMTAFFKTVFIVIMLGLLHALVFLPVVLSVFSCKLSTRYFTFCCKSGENTKEHCTNGTEGHVNDACDLELNNSKFVITDPEPNPATNETEPVVQTIKKVRKSVRLEDDSSNDSTIPEDPAVR